ncbi:hypothetical protein MZO44_15960, partial [Lactiplantibacillus sp. E932]|uniref:hypothetical protein n=1 Tax=Lactiplantibacillus plantarum TaxID=1590 RepID=UPI002076F328
KKLVYKSAVITPLALVHLMLAQFSQLKQTLKGFSLLKPLTLDQQDPGLSCFTSHIAHNVPGANN